MIITYLIKALTEKESVYVNKLGLFSKQYEPAQIHDGQITPPGYKVVFDPDYDGNGFGFTMFVSQQAGLLITDATMQIDQWVSQLKTALDNNKSISFENFGTFAKNENGEITYDCDRITELNTDYEGLEPVSISIHNEETDQEEVVENKPEEEVVDSPENNNENENENENQNENVNEQNEDGDKTEDDKADENGESPKKNKWWIVLVILLVLALLAATAYYFKDQLIDLYHQYFDQQTEIVTEEPISIDEPTVTETDTTDSILPTDTITPEEEITEPVPVSQLPDGENFFINFEKGKHYVIVGSFRSEKEVRQHIKDRNLEQYNPKIVIHPDSKKMRICVGVFDTEADADSYGRNTGLNYWVLN